MGTTPASARPSPTASKTARKPPTASVVDASPKYAWTASSANAPGSPENAASGVTPATARAGPRDAARSGPGAARDAAPGDAAPDVARGDAAPNAELGSWLFITRSIRGPADRPAGRRNPGARSHDRTGFGESVGLRLRTPPGGGGRPRRV